MEQKEQTAYISKRQLDAFPCISRRSRSPLQRDLFLGLKHVFFNMVYIKETLFWF
jgi:hypothetical protein